MEGSTPHPYLLCVEHYRNTEARHDAEDYFVDGLVLLQMPLVLDSDRVALEATMKKLILELQSPENEQELAKSFSKFHALRQRENLWWVHLMRKEHKERLPQDFHTNAFTEEELLGTATEEDPDDIPREMWFDRDGDPIEGPPDRMMAFLYS
jgi:hypothetical protein